MTDIIAPGQSPVQAIPPPVHTSPDPARRIDFESKSMRPEPGATALDTALWALDLGLWPVAIKARTQTTKGKEPIGLNWGVERRTAAYLQTTFKRTPKAGVGVCLGPGRGPGGSWLIDVEGDGPEAPESLRELLGGEAVESLGWSSTRGNHLLLIADDERLLGVLGRLADCEDKHESGTFHLPELPGLELRVGGARPDGAAKQIQSVTPPTLGTDGEPRRWNGHWTILPAPDAFYAALGRHASRTAAPDPDGPNVGGVAPPPHKNGRATYDRNDVQEAIAARGLFRDLAAEWGLRLTGNAEGEWATCHAIGRDDNTPSAGLSTKFGVYHDFGSGSRDSFFDLAVKLGRYPDWQEAVNDLGGRLGVSPRNGQHHEAGNGQPHETDNGDRPADPDGPQSEPEQGELPRFANFGMEYGETADGRPTVKKVAIRLPEIMAQLRTIVGDWPKRVGGDLLFVETADHRPLYLDSAEKLFAWLDQRAAVEWSEGASFITAGRFYQSLRQTAEPYEGIETLPHWPRLPGVYYMHPDLPPSSGKHLERFLDFFCPDTPADRELIRAFILTILWGGESGDRPAFLVKGPEGDRGRGVGKSMVPKVIFGMLGGYLDVSANESIEAIKTRLLSDGNRKVRGLLLDNIKTLRLSVAEIESLITSEIISGRQLYRGNGDRPNTLTAAFTMNGGSLSSDLAERIVTIKLARPTYDPAWESSVRAYAKQNRQEIIADAIELLRLETPPIDHASRWAPWEQAVLSKTPRFLECQRIIAERQAEMDDDRSDQELVESYFRKQLKARRVDPDTQAVFIPSCVVADWIESATRERRPTNKASTYLGGLGIPELRKAPPRKGKPGWVWKGAGAHHDFRPMKLPPEPLNFNPATWDDDDEKINF